MKKIKFLAAAAAAVIGLAFTTCALEGAKEQIVDAAAPVISDAPPPNIEKEIGGWVELAVVISSPSDGGSLTYQWYQLDGEYDNPQGTAISGATNPSFEVQMNDEGIYHYYVAITNTNPNVNGETVTTVNSSITTVAVNAPGADVKYPIITVHPADDTKLAGIIDLSVTAAPGAGQAGDAVLSYQWYSSDSASNKNGTLLTGATAAVYSPNLTSGTWYYYVKVSANLTGEEPKTATSHTAVLTIIAEMTPNAAINISPGRKAQYVRGFGGMDIPWDNFFRITMDEYDTMFNPVTGLGLNIMRIMIMPGVPDTSEVGVELEGSDNIEKTMDFYINGGGNRPDYYNGVKLVNQYGGYVLASPWSPPPIWKSNGTKNGGGNLLPIYYSDYAAYLKRYCQHMLDNGAPIYAVSIQNEPNFRASYDGCEWTSEEMRDFFKQQGHFTDGVTGWGGGKAIPVVLTMNGESANNPNINDRAMDDPVSRAAIDVLGRHTYGENQVRYAKALDISPKKEVWMTEHNINSGNIVSYPNDSTWNYVWRFMNDIDLSIRLNDESAFVWWALKRFYSIIGEGQHNTVEGAVLPRGYGLSHYAKYAKEMWRIALIASGTTKDGAAISDKNFNNPSFSLTSTVAKGTAFISDDGNTISLVLFTPTNDNGTGGVDMGIIEIKLPDGFIPTAVTAMRSTAAVKAKSETVMLSNDKTSAFVMLPPGNILSVKFTK